MVFREHCDGSIPVCRQSNLVEDQNIKSTYDSIHSIVVPAQDLILSSPDNILFHLCYLGIDDVQSVGTARNLYKVIHNP